MSLLVVAATVPGLTLALEPLVVDLHTEAEGVEVDVEANISPDDVVDGVAPDAPSAPRELVAVAHERGIELSWRAPAADGGAPVMDYLVLRAKEGSAWLEIGRAAATAFQDAGVEPGASYAFRVVARNLAGDSPASNEAAVRALSPPGAPQSLDAVGGARRVTLYWGAPAEDGGPVRTYAVYGGNASGRHELLGYTANRSFVESGLPAGLTRYCVVTAINGVGEGPRSDEASGGTAPLPSRPRDLNADGGGRRIALAWQPPVDDGGLPITEYVVYRDGVTPRHVVGSATSTGFVDANLTDGETHEYRVAAVTDAGIGPASDPARATTLGLPSAPQQLRAYPGVREVRLNWSAPESDGGRAILGYRVHRLALDGRDVATFETRDTWFSDRDLSSGATYAYTVGAFTELGEGARSGVVNATTVNVPSAPLRLNATGGNNRVTLVWKAPDDDGGAPVQRYRIYLRGEGPSIQSFLAETSATTWVDEPVPGGATRAYVVSAVNAAGEGAPSNVAQATAYGPPAPPRELVAIAGKNAVNLTWNAPATDGGARVQAYHVWRADASGTTALHAKVPASQLRYFDGNVTAGQTYRYVVTAVAAGESAPSNEATATAYAEPGAPELTAKNVIGGVVLTWTKSAERGAVIQSYTIYVSDDEGRPVPFRTVPGSQTSFNDTSVPAGESRVYRVSATNAGGEGARSNAAVGAPMGAPGAPRDIDAQLNLPSGAVRLTWTAPRGDGGFALVKYRIYRGYDAVSLTLVGEVPATSNVHWDETCSLGRVCYYAVSAVNSFGEGGRSEVVSTAG